MICQYCGSDMGDAGSDEDCPMNPARLQAEQQNAVAELVRILAPLRTTEDDPYDNIRSVVCKALEELDVYGASGCRLCLN